MDESEPRTYLDTLPTWICHYIFRLVHEEQMEEAFDDISLATTAICGLFDDDSDKSGIDRSHLSVPYRINKHRVEPRLPTILENLAQVSPLFDKNYARHAFPVNRPIVLTMSEAYQAYQRYQKILSKNPNLDPVIRAEVIECQTRFERGIAMKVPLNKDYHQWTWEEYFFFSPCHWCSCCCREIFSFQSQTHPDPPIIDLYCQNCGSVLRSCPATYIGFASCKNVKFQYLRDLPGCFKKNRESKCWWKWKRFSHPFPIVPGSSKT